MALASAVRERSGNGRSSDLKLRSMTWLDLRMALLHGRRTYVAKSSSQDWVTKLRWMSPFSKLAEIGEQSELIMR
jgi:hypothetical protein